MKTKIEQNKNSSVKRISCFVLSAFVLLISISVPAFATTTPASTNGVDFTGQPLPVASSFSVNTSLYLGSSGNFDYYAYTTSTASDVYFFLYRNNSSLCLNAASETNGNTVYFITYNTSSNSVSSSYNFIPNTLNSSYNLYYLNSNPSVGFSSSSTCPVFSNRSDGITAVRNWIDNPPVAPAEPHPIAITLKPGYVGYFDVTDLTNVRTVLGTSLFSGSKFPGFSTSQAIGVVSSLPSGSFSLPIAGTNSINWAGSGQKNLIGQYSNFSYTYITSTSGSSYLVVVNPLSGSAPVLSALGASGSNRNGNITVLIDQCRASKIYSLTESLAIGSGNIDTDSNGTSVNDGTYDPDAGAWDFKNPSTGLPEDPSALPVGGGNDPIIGGNGGNTINEWLEDIANSIKSFFSGAVGAVTTLVSSGSDFIHSLSGLYAWLPAPVYAVLTSALILVITIGVIKVFL